MSPLLQDLLRVGVLAPIVILLPALWWARRARPGVAQSLLQGATIACLVFLPLAVLATTLDLGWLTQQVRVGDGQLPRSSGASGPRPPRPEASS